MVTKAPRLRILGFSAETRRSARPVSFSLRRGRVINPPPRPQQERHRRDQQPSTDPPSDASTRPRLGLSLWSVRLRRMASTLRTDAERLGLEATVRPAMASCGSTDPQLRAAETGHRGLGPRPRNVNRSGRAPAKQACGRRTLRETARRGYPARGQRLSRERRGLPTCVLGTSTQAGGGLEAHTAASYAGQKGHRRDPRPAGLPSARAAPDAIGWQSRRSLRPRERAHGHCAGAPAGSRSRRRCPSGEQHHQGRQGPQSGS